MWTLDILNRITSVLGKPICMDKATKNLDRITYARCLVEVDASKPLARTASAVLDDGSIVTADVKYEGEPPRCTKCTSFGHEDKHCTVEPALIQDSVDAEGLEYTVMANSTEQKEPTKEDDNAAGEEDLSDQLASKEGDSTAVMSGLHIGSEGLDNNMDLENGTPQYEGTTQDVVQDQVHIVAGVSTTVAELDSTGQRVQLSSEQERERSVEHQQEEIEERRPIPSMLFEPIETGDSEPPDILTVQNPEWDLEAKALATAAGLKGIGTPRNVLSASAQLRRSTRIAGSTDQTTLPQ